MTRLAEVFVVVIIAFCIAAMITILYTKRDALCELRGGRLIVTSVAETGLGPIGEPQIRLRQSRVCLYFRQ